MVVPLEYDDVEGFSNGFARVAKVDADGSQRYGFIDTAGQVVVPIEYDYCGQVNDGTADPTRFFYVVKGISLGIYEKLNYTNGNR